MARSTGAPSRERPWAAFCAPRPASNAAYSAAPSGPSSPGDGQGTRGGGPGREQRELAVSVALDALRRTGGSSRARCRTGA